MPAHEPCPAAPARAGRGTPVFLDPTGARWQRARWTALLLLLPVLLLGLGSLALASTRPSGTLPAAELSVAETGTTLPVVGTGPLVRVLRLVPGHAGTAHIEDPGTGRAVRPLNPGERARAGGSPYVLERYGYAGGPRQQPSLLLTFDGGPDPTYTERVLAVLARHGVRASFFVTGQAAAREPDLVRQVSAEGHVVGNRTLTYVNVGNAPQPRVHQELLVADRNLRALTGRRAGVVRLPYAAGDDTGLAASVPAILAAQRQGYAVMAYDAEVEDLTDPEVADTRPLPLPRLDGRDLTVRLHDGGGKGRQRTVDYVDRLIPYAQSRGYMLPTLTEGLPDLVSAVRPVDVTLADRSARLWTAALLGWPHKAVTSLFWFAVLAVVGVSGVTVCLALRRGRRRRRLLALLPAQAGGPPLRVTVLIAAYNEENVIGRTLESLGASRHPLTELLVVDDGSTDDTAARVLTVAARDPRVRLLSQANTGKSGALNNGLRVANGDVVVTVDADTLVSPETVGNLVRHFALDTTGRLAAVAGVVRVGNRDLNLLTRWQSLEYLTQISVERAAHDALGAITIVPGACAAWRRGAVMSVGGYSEDTLAEDCDLSLSLHRAGWRVTQDDEALAFTEAPATLDDLLKQRVRWTFGTLQAITKHRGMLLRPRFGWLGMLVMPWYVASLLVPLLTIPFVAVMGLVAVRTQGWAIVGFYFAAFSLAHLTVAATGVRLARESWRQLLVVPVYRVVYEPLRAYLLYVSAYSALRGVKVGWNKLARAGTVRTPLTPLRAAPAAAAESAHRVIDLRDPVRLPV